MDVHSIFKLCSYDFHPSVLNEVFKVCRSLIWIVLRKLRSFVCPMANEFYEKPIIKNENAQKSGIIDI